MRITSQLLLDFLHSQISHRNHRPTFNRTHTHTHTMVAVAWLKNFPSAVANIAAPRILETDTMLKALPLSTQTGHGRSKAATTDGSGEPLSILQHVAKRFHRAHQTKYTPLWGGGSTSCVLSLRTVRCSLGVVAWMHSLVQQLSHFQTHQGGPFVCLRVQSTHHAHTLS